MNQERVDHEKTVAQVALFLASDDSRFVYGSVVTADASWTAVF